MKVLWLLWTFLLSGIVPALAAQPQPAPIEIKLQHGDAAETRTRDQLLRLLRTYDASRWIFTRSVVIDSSPGVLPHSHPVLTLNTRHFKDDDLLLSTFLHENLHHFLSQNHEKAEAAKKELRAVFPKVPVGYPDGGRLRGFGLYPSDRELPGVSGGQGVARRVASLRRVRVLDHGSLPLALSQDLRGRVPDRADREEERPLP